MGNRQDLPRVLNQKKAIALLETEGWTKGTPGNHQTKMVKPGHRPITLPEHKGQDYAPGLRSRILRQAGLVGPTPAEEEPTHDE